MHQGWFAAEVAQREATVTDLRAVVGVLLVVLAVAVLSMQASASDGLRKTYITTDCLAGLIVLPGASPEAKTNPGCRRRA